ncbi:MAG: LptF/LptG family permease [Candidatus Brocadiaceae bacterium]|uniref:LptF/LptG family permease n=1 Tax=Candidatus Wunengus sp. YC61 TaxID=3367698 RepID=UPI002718A4CD|nr:LptF/LptG family permease [Candidatus Brocadiaceae bacterium]
MKTGKNTILSPLLFISQILQRYLAREWFRTFLPSFVCFELLIFLGFAIQLLHKGLDIIALRALIPHLFIQAAPYSIPAALLTATAMTYGRMGADHEIVAIQTSGVHIQKIITPVLVIGVVFSLITLALSAEVLPRSCYKIILLQERAINNVLSGRLASFQKKIDLYPYQIYIGSVEDNVNKDIAVIEYANDYVTDVILAEEGAIKMDESENKILLTLYRGEFIKPNYKKTGEIPRVGAFSETTFEISLKEKKRESSTKYLTVFQLYKCNSKINEELYNITKTPSNSKKDNDALAKELGKYKQDLSSLSKKREKLLTELKRSNVNLARQKSKMEGLANECKIAKNYILVASENLIQVKRENKSGTSIEDTTKKIMQIKETIEKEKQRIYSIEQNITTAKNIQNDELKNIDSLTRTLSEINAQRESLLNKSSTVETDLTIANKKELIRKNNISIHKRLSQALSCITFIIIGIPLGIKLRSGNLMIGFGASFLVILFFYYPLVVTGIVLAENSIMPVIPAIWGANIILFIGGMFIFRKLYTT